jgi:molybdenum cofactor cytidylyltransferase
MNHNVAAILLAAGKSQRMGSCKQLLKLGDKIVISLCLETLLAGGVTDIVVVVSETGQSVAETVAGYPVKTVVNPAAHGDMASSIRVGRDSLVTDASGVIISLCDYPLVSSATIANLIRKHQSDPDKIIIPCHEGKRGHPLLFPRSNLDRLEPDMTLRDLVREQTQLIQNLETDDQGILIDMDTPEDYHRICTMIQN